MAVGLGNPGRTYRWTRHNVGWMVIDTLARRYVVRLTRPLRRHSRLVARFAEVARGTQRVRLVKPLTMMNRSGEALALWRDGATAGDWLLVCDDVNLPLGRLRLRAQGSAGGHHGLQSCVEALGTERVARLRIGIGGGRPGADLTRWVLSPFDPAERPQVTHVVQRAVQAVETWIEQGIEVAMQRTNTGQDG